jgi:hypothetical protein
VESVTLNFLFSRPFADFVNKDTAWCRCQNSTHSYTSILLFGSGKTNLFDDHKFKVKIFKLMIKFNNTGSFIFSG